MTDTADLREKAEAAMPKPISEAPRDGTPFIAWNADHPSFGPKVMMRRVRYISDGAGFKCHDQGSWLVVCPIEPDYDNGHDTPKEPHIPLAVAPDKLNGSVNWVFIPLPGHKAAAELTALRAKVKAQELASIAMREALKPFVLSPHAAQRRAGWNDDLRAFDITFTIGDLRRATAAYASLQETKND